MKTIIVNSVKHGERAILLDDEDYKNLNQFTWCVQKCGNKYYATRKKRRTQNIVLHRLILGLTDRKIYVDHIDGNGLNNQRSNLRIANHSENLCNRKAVKNSISRFKGVSWVSSHKLWRAGIQKDKVPRLLGYFKNEEDAARVYDAAAKVHHGEFAYLNFKD